jgi:hypothetical protein
MEGYSYLNFSVPGYSLYQSLMKYKLKSKDIKFDFIILGMMTLPKDREIVTSMNYLVKLDQALPRKISFCLGGTEAIDIQKLLQNYTRTLPFNKQCKKV